jgi:mannose/fructose/N-acetylgalactosamine-specific phosphotransferase system component IIB
MIKLLRVDDRLLHGQVAFSWTRSLTATDIIIANEEVSKDEFQKTTLKLAKPRGVNLQILGLSATYEFLMKHENSKNKVMVIVNNLEDANNIIKKAPFIKSLNLGGLRERKGSIRYTGSVTLTSEDLNICKGLMEDDVEIEIRQVPEEKKINLATLI